MKKFNMYSIMLRMLFFFMYITNIYAGVPENQNYTDKKNTVLDTSNTKGNFTQQIWDENLPLYNKIFNMSFNKELLSGKLNEQIFKNYIIQDFHYLQNYRKVYGILLSKAQDKEAMKLIVNLINGIDEEITLIHNNYIKKFDISEKELENTSVAPITEFYNSYLIKTATLEPFEVGLIATLPCYWIYYQLGIDMKRTNEWENSKYQEWINGYGDNPWETSETKDFVDLVEKYASKTTDANRVKMKKAYSIAMKLEYMFWDSIYNNVKWIK